MQRYLSIDIARGMAILLMIQVHFVENLSPREVATAWLYDFCVVLGSFAAPMFAFVSGLSYGLWLRKQRATRRSERDITRVTLRRGLFLFVLGLAFNATVWLPEEIFNWDILTLLGTAFLILAFARHLPAPVLILACVLAIVISPPLRVVADYSAYWSDDGYTYDFTLRDILFGFIANGFFPIFPWIVFPLLGFIATDTIFHREQVPPRRVLWLLTLCLLGVAALVLAGPLPTLLARFYRGLTEFPASTAYVLAMLGVVLLALTLLHDRMDQNALALDNLFIVKQIRRFSAFSLTVYIAHHLVILWPLWIAGAWSGASDPTVLWRQAMSTPLALTLAGAFIVLCSLALIVLENVKRFSLEAIMRRICD